MFALAIAQTVCAVAGLIGVGVAVYQLRAGRREAAASRRRERQAVLGEMCSLADELRAAAERNDQAGAEQRQRALGKLVFRELAYVDLPETAKAASEKDKTQLVRVATAASNELELRIRDAMRGLPEGSTTLVDILDEVRERVLRAPLPPA